MSRYLLLLVVLVSFGIIPGCSRPAIDRGGGPGGQDAWTGTDAYLPGEDASEAVLVCGDKPRLDTRTFQTDPRVEQALTSLTLPEKIEQMNGLMVQFDMFKTPDNERMQLRGLYFLDGPRGVRAETGTASCFPVSVSRAATWDLDLEYRIGEAMGRELRGYGYNILLAPTVNVLRHPAWGRGQETYGEDPWLLGMMGIAFTKGVQTRVAACVKHLAGNNLEDTRMTNNAIIDQQTLREVYTRQFQMIVEESDVACVMAAYNKLNGAYCCENKPLLRDLLKDEWGFDGFVVSDWFAAQSTVDSALAGMDVEMPIPEYYQGLEQAVAQNQVPLALIDDAARRILRIKFKFGFALLNEPYEGDPADIESDPHKALAREAGRKGMVLLKNADEVLPIDTVAVKKIAVVGPWADKARLGDAGSSNVVPSYAITPFAGIQARAGRNSPAIEVVTGTDASSAAGADLAIVVVALTQDEEGEAIFKGGDRDSLEISGDQQDLIKAVAKEATSTVVVMEAGGPITMDDWFGDVDGVVMAWYPGMEGGHAMAEVLFGDHNFEGRLPQTWPKNWDDNPVFGNLQNETQMDFYHGYRHFDHNGIEPLFPFGFGLSYTTFQFGNLVIPCDAVTESGRLVVTVDVQNTGSRKGIAVPQAYVGRPESTARKFERELKGFARVSLEPGETKTVEIPIRIPDLKVWDTAGNRWVIEKTTYRVEVGHHAGDLPLSGTFVVGTQPALRENGGEE